MTLSANDRKACSVKCPTCGAPVGRRCVDSEGKRMQGKVHLPRAVARHRVHPSKRRA